jgi:glucose-1-phosphate cytidylyltransferase
MKVVILAGGFGSRISEESILKPKPMIEIGDKPILWHIMKIFSHYGYNDFVILLGYKGYYIKEYFHNYFLHQSDLRIDLSNNSYTFSNSKSENWKIELVDTGLDTMTGGRIKKVQKLLNSEPFFLTYGDGVANVDIKSLLAEHNASGKTVTMTAVMPEGRFGALNISPDNTITNFLEKPKGDGSWINGGFFVCENEVFNYINDEDSEVFERRPLEKLALDKKLGAYKHKGFWSCMDTLRDKNTLNDLWNNNSADWKIWKI